MFLRSLRKDFLKAAKAETRRAEGRRLSTERVSEHESGAKPE
jgi:hypothetical protein